MTEQNEKVVRRHAGCPEEDALIYYFLVSLKSFRAVEKPGIQEGRKGFVEKAQTWERKMVGGQSPLLRCTIKVGRLAKNRCWTAIWNSSMSLR